MPVRNEEAHIAQTLRQLLDQEQGNLEVEIIVADGRSTDRTREIVQELARKHRQSLSITSLIPALFLLGLVLGPVVSALLPVLWPFYFFVVMIYAIVVLSFSVLVAISARRFSFLILLPIVFATIHLGSGWGVIREFASLSKSGNGSLRLETLPSKQ